MTRILSFCLSIVLAANATVAWAGVPRQLTIVLDCSQEMSAPLGEAARSPSRFQAATAATSKLLEALANDGAYNVTLVLYAHNTLASGQAVLESHPLSVQELQAFNESMQNVKAQKAAPLLDAILKAAEVTSADEVGSSRILVITSGVDRPTKEAASPAVKEVLEALRTAKAEVNIVQVGEDDAMSAELLRIVEATGGITLAASNSKSLDSAVKVGAGLAAPKAPIAVKQVNAESAADLVQTRQPEPLPDAGDDELRADVFVEVTYWGRPVTDAKVYFHGENFDLEYDRTLEYKSRKLRLERLAGVYHFQKVPDGPYRMEINANVKNRTFVVWRGFSVDDENRAPGRKFKIELEKAKDPLFQPPGPAPLAP